MNDQIDESSSAKHMLPQALLDALLRLLREALRSAPGLVLRVLDIAFSPPELPPDESP